MKVHLLLRIRTPPIYCQTAKTFFHKKQYRDGDSSGLHIHTYESGSFSFLLQTYLCLQLWQAVPNQAALLSTAERQRRSQLVLVWRNPALQAIVWQIPLADSAWLSQRPSQEKVMLNLNTDKDTTEGYYLSLYNMIVHWSNSPNGHSIHIRRQV